MRRLFWIPLVVLAADQFTKLLAVAHLGGRPPLEVAPFFNLVLVHNTGAAFGVLNRAGGWQNLLFIGVALAVAVGILTALWREKVSDYQVGIALWLVVGGAVGNLVDRVRLGYVIDFVDIYYRHWHWPAFNIADSAIVVAAALLVADALGLQFKRRVS
jgi:signal peptidase II